MQPEKNKFSNHQPPALRSNQNTQSRTSNSSENIPETLNKAVSGGIIKISFKVEKQDERECKSAKLVVGDKQKKMLSNTSSEQQDSQIRSTKNEEILKEMPSLKGGQSYSDKSIITKESQQIRNTQSSDDLNTQASSNFRWHQKKSQIDQKGQQFETPMDESNNATVNRVVGQDAVLYTDEDRSHYSSQPVSIYSLPQSINSNMQSRQHSTNSVVSEVIEEAQMKEEVLPIQVSKKNQE